MRAKYLPIFSHRSDCGTQPLWAWMAWYLASCLAMSLRGRRERRREGLNSANLKVYVHKRTYLPVKNNPKWHTTSSLRLPCVQPLPRVFWKVVVDGVVCAHVCISSKKTKQKKQILCTANKYLQEHNATMTVTCVHLQQFLGRWDLRGDAYIR